MKTKGRYTIYLTAVTAVVILAIGCNSYKVRREMVEGQKEYRAANFQAAAAHFKAASALDDNFLAAKLNLAAAYRATPPDPGVSTPEGAWFGQQAIDTYQKVLEKDPHNMLALKGIGCTALDMKKFDQAMDAHKRILALTPNDPESYFWVGVVDWAAVNEDLRAQKVKLGLGADDPFRGTDNDRSACEQARGADAARVAEGLTMLQTAIDKRPDYDDAMVFMVLVLWEKTDMQCGDLKAWDEYRTLSDKWVNQGYAARKRKIENAYKPSKDKGDTPYIIDFGCSQPNPVSPAQTAQQQAK
ncbi:MAG TPA: tetratricopeptide repeat protein [Candidatus Angelobacter sp.]|nr:tetratricopeptide repeat protein [Candidatus Angelobacter sp.]